MASRKPAVGSNPTGYEVRASASANQVNAPVADHLQNGQSTGGGPMARCDLCNKEYDKTFEVSRNGDTFTFDSFECAIHMLAPSCAHCGCQVIGHGVESEGIVYCCAHCAREMGESGLRDRADGPVEHDAGPG
jgi:Rieske Fe-S protein